MSLTEPPIRPPEALRRYREIDTALAESYFNESRAGRPVYLDMDDSVLGAVAGRLGIAAEHLEDEICSAVRRLLVLDESRAGVLSRFNAVLEAWHARFESDAQEGEVPPHPPIVALLAAFTLAAERMGDADSADLHVNAYYPRLVRILDLPTADHARFQQAFMKYSESYWNALAAWLEALDGDRGLPTAYALRQRYIGLPISQALVRQAERKQLLRMFEEMELPQGTAISAVDMDATLNDWIMTADPPPSANLRSLWTGGAREAVVDTALVEFDNWDGIARYGKSRRRAGGAETGEIRTIRLTIGELFDVFESSFEFSGLLPSPAEGVRLRLDSTAGPVPIAHQPIGNGMSALSFGQIGIEPVTVFEGIVRVAGGDDRTLARFPRKLVPFAWDTMLNRYVEVERIPVGERAALLVSEDEGLSGRAEQALAEAARTGYVKVTAGRGVPAGWTLFTEVLLLQAPTSITRGLEALVPRLSVQMSLTGGFRIPGRIARWNTLALPELTVVADDSEELTVELQMRSLDAKLESRTIQVGPAPIVIALTDVIHRDGDYTIVLKRGRTPIQTQTVRARSAATPDPAGWRNFEGVGHDGDDPLWPVRAVPVNGDLIVEGAQVFIDGAPAQIGEVAVTVIPTSRGSQTELPSAKLALPLPEPTSCILTGAHHWDLPRDDGKHKEPFMTGTCRNCGMRKRYPTQYWQIRGRKHKSTAGQRISPASFPPQPSTVDWSPALDTIVYLGKGSATDLSAVARQIENSAPFEHHFVRSLEALGYLETSRSQELEVEGFEIAATTVAGLPNGRSMFTGSWSHADFDALREDIAAKRLPARPSDQRELRMLVIEADPADAIDRLELDGTAAEAPDAAIRLLLALPRLSTITDGLRLTPMSMLAGRAERFDPARARWTGSDRTDIPGAYRRKTFGSNQHVIRTEDDIALDQARPLRSDVAKYLAATIERTSLARYDAVSSELSVPLGSPLPGLYERAAVLMSGRLPSPSRADWTLRYHEITPEFADQLIARLL